MRRTTFHVLAMYATMLGERVLPSTATSDGLDVADVPVIDQLATVDEAGTRVTLALVNRDPATAVGCDVRLGGHGLAGSFPGTVLDGPSADAFNDVEHPGTVVPGARRSGSRTAAPPCRRTR